MEWISNALRHSDLEKDILKTEQISIFKRYSSFVDTQFGSVYTIDAPSFNADKITVKYTLVFIHGLGGNVDSFSSICKSLNQYCEILLLDLPGNGMSPNPTSDEAFKPSGIVVTIEEVILKKCKTEKFVMVGHSYGTSHCFRVSIGKLKDRCKGVIAITPPLTQVITPGQRAILKLMPNSVFDLLFRSKDRVGGLHSASVNRLVSPEASDKVRMQQLKVNLRARTTAVLRTLVNIKIYNPELENVPEQPVLIVCALNDKVCDCTNGRNLSEMLKKKTECEYTEIHDAGHAVIFEKHETVCGLISFFLTTKIDDRLSMTWQLQSIASKEDKWSLKNEQKWSKVKPVGEFVGGSFFKGMKVLREQDLDHGPEMFHNKNPEIRYIIDISREAPPYTPEKIDGVTYVKYPTVSKVPPTKQEVEGFIELVNELKPNLGEGEAIAVHCHYGYNRTGFFICSYLIEELKFSVSEAVDAYKKSRDPGIRHEHFINELYLRYNL